MSGQSGLTLRVMESIFYKKKIITNNKEIIRYDISNPESVFILGVDSDDQLKNFLETPYKEHDNSVTEQYNLYNWTKRLFSVGESK